MWTGVINSAQFVGVVIGCLLWGYISDRRGPRFSLLVTVSADAAIFTATAFAREPGMLLLLRFLVGAFSPLVPSLAYLFEAVPMELTANAIAAYSFAVIFGLALGNASVSLYDAIGWRGLGLLSGGLALGALVFGALALRATRAGEDARRRAKPQGVLAALRSGNFITHAYTGFACGFFLIGRDSLLAVDLLMRFGFDAGLVGLVFLSAPASFIVANFVVPPLVARHPIQLLITVGTAVAAASCALLTMPALNGDVGWLVGISILSNFGLAFMHVPNQMRPRLIGAHQTTNGTGSITGASRTLWSVGQALGPTCCVALYTRVGPWAPWALLGAVTSGGALLLHPLCRVSLLSDPWRPMTSKSAVAVAPEGARLPAASPPGGTE